MLMLNGTGMLRSAGKDLGKVNYQILLDQRGTLRLATGTFAAQAPLALGTDRLVQPTLVADDNGFEMTLTIKSLTADGKATFAVPGPVVAGL